MSRKRTVKRKSDKKKIVKKRPAVKKKPPPVEIIPSEQASEVMRQLKHEKISFRFIVDSEWKELQQHLMLKGIALETRLDGIDKRIDELQAQVDAMDRYVAQTLDELKVRVEGRDADLEAKMADSSDLVYRLTANIGLVATKQSEIEAIVMRHVEQIQKLSNVKPEPVDIDDANVRDMREQQSQEKS